MSQKAINEKRVFSSSQSEIGNKHLSKVQTVGCARCIYVSRRSFINEIVGANDMGIEHSVCLHNSSQQIDDISLNSQKHCSSGKEAHDLDAGDK